MRPPELLELLRLAKELDDLLQLFLGLVNAGHILKGDLLLLHREQARAAFSEGKRFVSTALHLPDHEEPQQRDQDERGELQQPAPPAVAVVVLHGHADLVLVEDVVEVGVVGRNDDVEGALVGAEVASNLLARNRDVGDLVRLHIPQKLGEGDLLLMAAHGAVLLEQLPQHQQARNDEHPEQDLFNG